MEQSSVDLPTILDGEDKSCALKNRIRKNYQHVRKWAKRTQTNCFRIYDREIREYPLALDFYDGRFCVHYFTRSRESEEPAPELKDLVEGILSSLFHAHPDSIYWRTRIKREKIEQYEKTDESRAFFTVQEYGIKFRVNLIDYLDTGLFLDHRETRKRVAAEAKGKRLLNLFAYTCAFSVHAAVSGAVFTKSVDMSNTYCEWGRVNFELNGIQKKHHPIVRADCLKFLKEEIESRTRYDVIVIDPPTISRSKKMDQFFDIQIDYISLLSEALQLLAPGGTLFFSTNSRKFTFDPSHFPNISVREISAQTLPIDFHDPKIHRCWKLV
jgi:23S rRNA G2069 N7-methylase RlmK/C1962 C5-methylase RlmI